MTNQQDKQIEVLLSLGLLKFSLEYSSIHTFRTHIDKQDHFSDTPYSSRKPFYIFLCRVVSLQKKLAMIEKREADETAALENMVQMVEKNLELTTVCTLTGRRDCMT